MKVDRQKEFLDKIENNKGIIYKICNSYCPNKNDREDLAQEMIYQLLKAQYSFDPAYKFSTWMYRIALNVAISHYRKQKQVLQFDPVSTHLQNIEDKQEATEKEEQMLLLERFINELKELDKALMILYLDARPYREMSEIVGISESNVATKIARIKEKLKNRFEELKKQSHGK